ncbi:hypothetical protein LTR28_003928 [Elasticomyces elasticus]|nr:hypothetical protein LTR28_003928 [Elasticomyces elasticus]
MSIAETSPSGAFGNLLARDVNDVFTQTFTLYLSDGEPFQASLADVNLFAQYGIKASINYGTQFGACVITLIILLMITKHEKQKAPIFIVNSLTLIFNSLRCLLTCLYYTGPYYNTYAMLAGDFSRVGTAGAAVTVSAEVFHFLTYTAVEISLILQVRVVCITMHRRWRRLVEIASFIVALLTVGFRGAYMVINCQSSVAARNLSNLVRTYKETTIMVTVSICFFSAIFASKLGWALWQRKILGLQQYGPIQIIFIMGLQTLFVPMLFTILDQSGIGNDTPQLNAFVPTWVCLFLPMSAMWAASNVKSKQQAARGPDAHRKLFGEFTSKQTPVISPGSRSRFGSCAALGAWKESVTSSTVVGSPGPNKATSKSESVDELKVLGAEELDKDLEMQGLGVKMNRTYEVHRDEV